MSETSVDAPKSPVGHDSGIFDLFFSFDIDPNDSTKEYIGVSQGGRTCRFCGKRSPEARFAHEAHVVPSAFGNRSLLSLEECDLCNDRSSVLEDHLSKFLVGERLTSMIRPQRKAVVKHRVSPGGGRVVATPGKRHLLVQTQPGDSNVKVAFTRQGRKVSVLMQPFKPANVARALARILLFVASSDELDRLQHVVEWVRGADLWARPRFYLSTLPIPLSHVLVRASRPASHVAGLKPYRIDLYFGAAQLICIVPDASWQLPRFVFPRDEIWYCLEGDSDVEVRGFSYEFTFVSKGFVPPTDEEVAVSAYYRWLAGGCRSGTAIDDWLAAESELVRARLDQGVLDECSD